MGFLSRPLDLTANFIGNIEDEGYYRKAISKIQNMGNYRANYLLSSTNCKGKKGKDT